MAGVVVVVIDADYFYCQVELLRDANQALRSQPVAVYQKHIVVTCNYPARAHGVGKLMRLSEARRRCPQLVCICGEDLAPYREYQGRILAAIAEAVDELGIRAEFGGCETVGYDEYIVDVTAAVERLVCRPPAAAASQDDLPQFAGHMFRGYDDAAKGDDDRGEDGVPAELVLRLAHGSHMAERLRAHIRRRTGLTTSAGIAPNKMLAKFGANMNKPDSQTTYLPTRGADRWLQSLPLRCFPGVGRSLARHLRERLGVTHAHHIRRAYASAAELAAAFERAGSGASTPPWPGRAAILLWDAVHGIHNEPVVARGLPRSISAEDSFVSMRPFSVAMRDKLGELVAECSERIEQDVQCNRRWPTRMAVKWRLAGQQRAAKGAMLSEAYREALAAGCRDVATPEVNHARQLFFEACWHLLQVAVGASEGASLTLLGVGVSNFEGHRRGNARKSGEGERCQNGRIDVLLRKRSHGEAAARRVACPLCGMFVDEYDNSNLNRHIDSCLQGASAVGDSRHSEMPEKLAGGGARRRLSVTLDAWVKRTRKRE